MKIWHIVVIGLVVLSLIIGGSVIGKGFSAWKNLVNFDQQYKAGGAHYGAALDIVSEKIEGVWSMYNQYLKQEQVVFDKAKEMRSAFYKAAAEGDPQKTIQAAMNFQLVAVHEAYPLLSSVPVAQQAMKALEEGVNEIKTALDDWIYATKTYNAYRASPILPLIVGNLLGFPKEYEYYKAEKAKLDISKIKEEAK